MSAVKALPAGVVVSIADARLARAMKRAIADAMKASIAAAEQHSARAGDLPVVRLRARKTLARLGSAQPSALDGALAIVTVSERNARHLPELVEGIRAAGVLAVQMVWNGREPEATRIDRYLFDVLERARATPSGPPVVLTKNDQLPPALRILIASRPRAEGRQTSRKDDRS